MTQSESVGDVQDRTAEIRDTGEKLACQGAEGGSIVKTCYTLIVMKVNKLVHGRKFHKHNCVYLSETSNQRCL